MYVVDKTKLIDFRRIAKNQLDCCQMLGCGRCAREIRKECEELGGIQGRDEQTLMWFRYILTRLEELDVNLLDLPDEEFLKVLG